MLVGTMRAALNADKYKQLDTIALTLNLTTIIGTWPNWTYLRCRISSFLKGPTSLPNISCQLHPTPAVLCVIEEYALICRKHACWSNIMKGIVI